MKTLRLIAMVLSCLTWWEGTIFAQRNIIFDEEVASVQVVAGVRWQDIPVIKLGGHESVNIEFDDLSHSYRRFTYSLTHLEADWSPSEGLFASDYLNGFQGGLTIDESKESINTIQNYTHYKLSLPNRECSFKMSGNYRLDIKDDNEDKPVLSLFFMVSEEVVNVGLSCTTNTDIDINHSHQQAVVKVDYSALRATDPRRQIKGYVLQNGRWDNVRVLGEPQRLNQRMMEWEHCRELIFDGGNEYHKFEILDVHRNSLNVENNAWDEDTETWHTILWPDYKRPSYVYDETARGSYIIRNSDNVESSTTSEYVNVHFILQSPLQPYRMFVNGNWTHDRFLPKYEMQYDEDKKVYEAVIPLKYGYYTYQYLMLPDEAIISGNASDNEEAGANTEAPLIPPTEGSYFQTRNKYDALIYYRGISDRADRLVGTATWK